MINLEFTFRLPDLAFVDSASSTSRGRARQEEARRNPRKSIFFLRSREILLNLLTV